MASAGAMIGRYRVVAELGAGAMGAVVRAHDDRLGRDVAIKRIKNVHGVAAAMFEARFEAEGRALAALSHPGVVAVFDLGVDDGQPYLVMELLAGPSLRDELARRGPLPLAEVAAIGIQLARALEAAHANQILHRDLKPANVVRGHDGGWKLVDFGVAHTPDSEVTLTGQFVGTPSYAAPEALTLGRFSPASDVFGLGATLCEIATATKPRADLTLADVIARADLPLVDDAVRARLGPLAPAITAALAVHPDQRPTAAALAMLLANPAPTTPAPPVRTGGSLPWRAIGVGAVVVLVLGLIGLGLDSDRGTAPPQVRPALDRPADDDEGPPPERFAAPRDLDDKGARDWRKVADKVTRGDRAEALAKLREFERKHGVSAESLRLRRWLEGQQ